MDIGIGLPNAVVGTTGPQLIEWAKRADQAGFSSLASIGAVSYPSFEELTVFAAAAAVTERARLFPNVLIAPARSTAELAKQTATVDQLSGGRLSLGLGPGWRAADFALTGRDFESRGSAFDRQLDDLQKAWSGDVIEPDTRPASPPPANGSIPILVGGTSAAAIRRVVEHGDGWTAGGLPPEMVQDFGGQVREAWKKAGKDGSPKIAALRYFGLGDVEEEARSYILDYYAPGGDELAGMVADNILRTPEAVQEAVQAYADAGVDELILDGTVADPGQVEQLAEVVLR